ncbi:DMT family transporter [Marinobacter fonticola]|uniref:DMT family transporter n=1 Tax=Marinobacter fonticola TaxID=2603215 RepID=UPI0011E6D97F|nr:SMR family transporter [Marinobacter fonticola]
MQNWLFLAAAICFEVVATSALKASEGFSKLWPSVLVVAGYALAFYFLALTLRTIPVGIAYAIWAGTGVALITLIGWLFFSQTLDLAAIIGILFIVIGVLILNVFSQAAPH